MKIALTGGTGFVGDHFATEATRSGHDIIIIGRQADRSSVVTKAGTQLPYHATDYSTASLTEILDGCNAVVHMAANRPTSDWTVQKYVENVKISQNLFDACCAQGIDNVVVFSSRSVYSIHNPIPWTEDMAVIPTNLYGASKAAVEILASHYNAFKGLRCKCLRLAQVLGYGEHGGYVLNTFIDRASQGQALELHGSGAGRREYIYIKDVVSAVFSALEHPSTYGYFNIGTGTNISIIELAQLINDVFANTGNLNVIPAAKEDTNSYLMSVEKTRQVLQWSAQWSMRAALEDMRDLR